MRWQQAIRALLNSPPAPAVHQARLQVSTQLLHEMLLMPDTMRVVGVTMNDPWIITVAVEDSNLAGVEEGQLVPEIMPVFSSHDSALVQAAWPLTEGAEAVIVGDDFPDDEVHVSLHTDPPLPDDSEGITGRGYEKFPGGPSDVGDESP